jgi:hypothetical protein
MSVGKDIDSFVVDVLVISAFAVLLIYIVKQFAPSLAADLQSAISNATGGVASTAADTAVNAVNSAGNSAAKGAAEAIGQGLGVSPQQTDQAFDNAFSLDNGGQNPFSFENFNPIAIGASVEKWLSGLFNGSAQSAQTSAPEGSESQDYIPPIGQWLDASSYTG